MYGRHKKAITMYKVQLKQERETFTDLRRLFRSDLTLIQS